jgi:hypothetical protein
MNKYIHLLVVLKTIKCEVRDIKSMLYDMDDTLTSRILEQYASKVLLILEVMQSIIGNGRDEK